MPIIIRILSVFSSLLWRWQIQQIVVFLIMFNKNVVAEFAFVLYPFLLLYACRLFDLGYPSLINGGIVVIVLPRA
jgi:hypothetical protein